jgi:acetylornithine deacetylase
VLIKQSLASLLSEWYLCLYLCPKFGKSSDVRLLKMQCLTFLSYGLSIASFVVPTSSLETRQDGGSSGGNLSLQHPELFSLHWRMLEQNSTSGFETPMVDFLSKYLKDKGLTVALQPVQNPILAYGFLI